MSKLKFRAWSKSEQKMYYDVRPFASTEFPGEQLAIKDLAWIDGYEFDGVLIDDVVIMQYTGRKDSEGNEIYEGDILQNEHHFEYQVLFKGDCWRCEPLKRNGFKNRFIGSDLKIIGNVYENQELLED